MESENSDYDVRFVYVQDKNEYLKINRKPDVISKTFDKDGVPCAAKGCVIDVEGFDVYKYLTMLSKSNPTMIEWLFSPIVYYGGVPRELKKVMIVNVNNTALYFHYKSMCRANYLKYIKSNSEVTYKKYLYAMRGLVNAKYVMEYYSIPRLNFAETLEVVTLVPKPVVQRLKEIIMLKKTGLEKSIVENEVKIDSYIESELKNEMERPEGRKNFPVEELDDWLLRKLK
jgi:predicted nucleotidyltransferase